MTRSRFAIGVAAVIAGARLAEAAGFNDGNGKEWMQLQGTVYTKLGTPNLKELSPELRDAVLKAGPGEVAQPFFSAAGLEIIMRCDPAPPKLIAFELPTRDQMQQQLFVQQMSLLAKSYLRDLRRDAVVETR